MDKNRMMLTDSQWYQIEKLLPSQAGKQGRPRNRLVIEGILWILRTGGRDLPKEKFGSWATIYGRWRDWILAGERIFEALKKKKIIDQKLLTQQVSPTCYRNDRRESFSCDW